MKVNISNNLVVVVVAVIAITLSTITQSVAANSNVTATTILRQRTLRVSGTTTTSNSGSNNNINHNINDGKQVRQLQATPVQAPAQPPAISALRLMYTGVNPSRFIRNLNFGTTTVNVIDLRTLQIPTNNDFNIEAIVRNDVGSVKFSNGRIETSKPLAYCGNDGLDFYSCDDLTLTTPRSTITINVTAYSGTSGTGRIMSVRRTTIRLIRSIAPTAPVPAPIALPPSIASSCPIPRLVGEWERPLHSYPISVAESQGTMIGNDFLITSGFKDGYKQATTETYAINMYNVNANWRRMDDMPFPAGLTHLGVAVKGMKIYFCGGYVGGALGVHNGSCFQYDHSILPGNNAQWTRIPALPDGGRSGGGMIYDSTIDALIYTAGSQRPEQGQSGAFDFTETFMLSLKTNPSTGTWVRKADIPFQGNHMNFVTAYDANRVQRHYFWGGQHGDEEEDGNTNLLYEYNAIQDRWIQRASVPFPIGHAAASARAIGCGFLFAGGRTNTGLTDAIMYYHIPTNEWIKIGELTNSIHTNVCIIANNILRCETGWATGRFSWQHRIVL